jgi:hypothetical protein
MKSAGVWFNRRPAGPGLTWTFAFRVPTSESSLPDSGYPPRPDAAPRYSTSFITACMRSW